MMGASIAGWTAESGASLCRRRASRLCADHGGRPGAWCFCLLRHKFVSNRDMHPPQDIDKRLTNLEIKASFGEDLLEQLNQVIIGQQQQIDLLIREVGRLCQPAHDAGGVNAGRAGDDLPPHY